MTITYELRAHSRDVSIAGIDLNKHTGYDLIAYDENGTAISIQTVDLNALSPLSGPIDFKMYSETLNIPIGGDIIPSKVYVDGEWENTSQQWVNENQYKNVALPLSSEDALEAFNKIKSYATLANTFLDMGLPISYDPTKQNCNSFVAEMNRNFMPEIDVFDELNKDEETPYHYIGEEYAFPASSLSSFDSVISSTIFSLLY